MSFFIYLLALLVLWIYAWTSDIIIEEKEDE
jgi:hypothetical protein